MNTVRELIQGELDRLQGVEANQEQIGRLADIAVEKGLRFTHSFDGTLDVDIPPPSNKLVRSFIDPEQGEQLYVGRTSARSYAERRRLDGYRVNQLLSRLEELKAWLPDEDVVALPTGERLGVKLETLPRLIDTMRHPPYHVQDSLKLPLSEDARQDVAKFYQAVLTPPSQK